MRIACAGLIEASASAVTPQPVAAVLLFGLDLFVLLVSLLLDCFADVFRALLIRAHRVERRTDDGWLRLGFRRLA
jgi:hypothetical protein